MSNGIQHKLYQLEIVPPDAVWSKILAELEDAALEYQFPKKIYALTQTPPPGVWDKIGAALDEALVAEDLPSKLYGAEETPPAAAWQKISAALDETLTIAPAKKRKTAPLLRYITAAAVLALMAAWALPFLRSGKPGKPVATETNLVPGPGNSEQVDKTGQTVSVPEVNNSNPASYEDARNDAALEASKKTYAKLDLSPKKRMEIASGFRFAGYSNSVNLRGMVEPGEDQDEPPASDIADRYIVLMTPEGNIIRMSKKLSDLVCCVSGEEQDADCKTQMDKWRKQLACSPASHAVNFMEILNLLSSLRDE